MIGVGVAVAAMLLLHSACTLQGVPVAAALCPVIIHGADKGLHRVRVVSISLHPAALADALLMLFGPLDCTVVDQLGAAGWLTRMRV